MTDQELDTLMRRVLLDSLKLDAESAASGELVFEPTPRYQRQMAEMVKDPLKWERRRARPLWKNVAQKAAVILLVFHSAWGASWQSAPRSGLQWYAGSQNGMRHTLFTGIRENKSLAKCHSMKSRICQRAMPRLRASE